MQFRRPPRRQIHGILLLDKPQGLSSHQALFVARGTYNADKAGHTGTLDPLATGLLPLCFGKATALCGHLLDARKRYVAEVRFGARTATGDSEGEALARSDPAGLSEAQLRASLPAFTGRITQIPPMYSALKRDGVPLHALAREGVEVERTPREVEIESLELLAFDGLTATLDVRCSKGTYIRTLGEDWAASLGQCAHLSGLRRLEVGPFGGAGQGEGIPLESLQNRRLPDLDALLLPARAALAGWRFVTAMPEAVPLLDAGRLVAMPGEPEGPVAIENPQGSLLGLGEITSYGFLQPRRWFGPEGI